MNPHAIRSFNLYLTSAIPTKQEWDQMRLQAIEDHISNSLENGTEVDPELMKERNDLIKSLKK